MVVVIDYNVGNVCLVLYVLECIGVEVVFIVDYEEIVVVEKVIFLGVGVVGFMMCFLCEEGLD